MNGVRPLPLYDKLPHGRHGLAPEVVRANQRARIFGATVELVNARGYATTTVQDIVTAANASKRTFYDLFGNKEDCFLWVGPDTMRCEKMTDSLRESDSDESGCPVTVAPS